MAKATEKTGREIALTEEPKNETPLAVRIVTGGIVPVRPAEIEVYEDMGEGDEATGLEDVSLKDRKIPILRPLDPKSPQCNPVENGGIPGAEQGDIFNTTTSEIYKRRHGLYFIPCHTDLKFVNYKKRDEDGGGGGFAGILEPNDPIVALRKKETIEKHKDLFRKLENGVNEEGKPLELVETHYLYGIAIRPTDDGQYPGEYGEWFPASIPMSSTQIKQHAALLERCKNFKYMLQRKDGSRIMSEVKFWSHVWLALPFLEKRGKQTWWGWRFSLAAKNEDGTEKRYQASRITKDNPLYKAAEDLRDTVLEGNAQIDFTKTGGAAEDGAVATSGHAQGGGGDQEIPFGQDG